MTKFNMERVKKMKVVRIAEYILTTKCTIREAAKEFKLSKTTIHGYMVNELPKYSSLLAKKVRKLLDYNKMDRHNRGGMATKIKYEKLKKKII